MLLKVCDARGACREKLGKRVKPGTKMSRNDALVVQQLPADQLSEATTKEKAKMQADYKREVQASMIAKGQGQPN